MKRLKVNRSRRLKHEKMRTSQHTAKAVSKEHAIALYLEWELKQRIIFYYFYKDPTRGYSHYSENNGRLTSVMMSDGSMFERTSISMENITSMEVDDPLHWRSG